MTPVITFERLTTVSPTEIAEHMSDPRVADHMPLLTSKWDAEMAAAFVQKKEQCWERDGLGHWAILAEREYVGWGGFQKEGDEWDYGLVLRPGSFGLGRRVTEMALGFARADPRIPFVTFLLPPTRTKLKPLDRLGAAYVGKVVHEGSEFLKYRLETP